MVGLIIMIFIVGYAAITLEHIIKINKTAPALAAGVLCWMVYILYSDNKELVSEQLLENLGEFSGILFFLMGAMTIVEIIDLHSGFNVITKRITVSNKKKLLWIICGITFFLSPILDNLTTAIVMVSLLQKIIKDQKEQFYFVGMIIIAANAGGAWSPIGDVTTTMLWLGGQITAGNIIKMLFIPSAVSLILPLLIITPFIKGRVKQGDLSENGNTDVSYKHQLIILITGFTVLIMVPAFKAITHLPPYMGILIGLSIIWIVTETIGRVKEKHDRFHLSPAYALRKIDSASILFFLGILLSIAALERAGLLRSLSVYMQDHIGNKNTVVLIMGFISAIIDNVPLMAAAQGMYPISEYPVNDTLWEFLAYCTGTGGSLLIIGSAAGVAAMGMAKVDFFWYLKNISWLALVGYLGGAGSYLLFSVV